MTGKRTNPVTSVFQLKATLKGSRPPIWRRIQVPANITFSRLHAVFQIVMDWQGYHLHQFLVGDRIVGSRHLLFDRGADTEVLNETRSLLNKLVPGPPGGFTYEYDFGDDWELLVSIEKELEPDPSMTYPFCMEGRMAAPPEDVGGIWGYYDMLDILKDENHPERDGILEYLGESFNPKRFDKEAINARLKQWKG